MGPIRIIRGQQSDGVHWPLVNIAQDQYPGDAKADLQKTANLVFVVALANWHLLAPIWKTSRTTAREKGRLLAQKFRGRSGRNSRCRNQEPECDD